VDRQRRRPCRCARKYTIKANKISLTDTGGAGKCSGTVVYRIVLTAASIKFTKVSDPNQVCGGWVMVLTSGRFAK
jgi:hypothetical protein